MRNANMMALGMISLGLFGVLLIISLTVLGVAGADLTLLLPAFENILLVIIGGVAGALTTNRFGNSD